MRQDSTAISWRRGARRAAGLALCLVLAACAGGPRLESPSHFGTPTHLSCVPYARQVSGIQLSGNAYRWWRAAKGVYPRTHEPRVGAVLVLKPHGAMDVGHLAVVTGLRGPREILVTQSNWLPHRIEHNQPVVDVSAKNDWSLVRVWYEPAHALGRTRYPAYGFILPN
ncbi:CHAP domain-containing protein [Acidocella sp.]|uniref:CHAP domain-containing protein n=1 Tax=Acidocella sp. TaxID=50710 RepID=UPI003CFC9CE8